MDEQVQPVINRFIDRKFIGSLREDADDFRQDVYVSLLKQLQKRERDSDASSIRDLNAYAWQIIRTTWHQYLARKRPQRYHLKNNLRHLLKTQRGFALWDDENDLLCGFAVWRDQRMPFDRTRRYQQLLDDPRIAPSDKEAARMSWADLLAAIFNWIGSPIELDDLVKIVAELKGIKDLPTQPLQGGDGGDGEEVFSAHKDPIDDRLYLEQSWKEILFLPLPQRVAFLLNDGKGGDPLELFWEAGIASLKQIAEALDVSDEQLAGIWNDLPLKDLAIADRLSVTRQQVINLRKAARERLCRRLG